MRKFTFGKDITPNATVKISNNLNDGFYLLQVHQGTDVKNINIVKHK